MNKNDRKSIITLVLWGIGGLSMVITGICAFIAGWHVSAAISAVLGIAALITGGITLLIRLKEKRDSSVMRFDWVIWFVLGILLLTTKILSAVGGIAFVVIGIALVLQGVNSFRLALSDKKPVKFIFSVIFVLVGVWMIFNASAIFDQVVAKVIGVYLIVHGAYLLYDWLGQVRYFRNFRGVEK